MSERHRARPIIRFLAGIMACTMFVPVVWFVRGTEATYPDASRPWIAVLGFAVAVAMGCVAITGKWPWPLPDERDCR
jgi:hypothetical protein